MNVTTFSDNALSSSIILFSTILFILDRLELETSQPRTTPSVFGIAYTLIQHVQVNHAIPNKECMINSLVHIRSSATTSLLKRIIELLHQADITDSTAPIIHAYELNPARISL